MGRKTGGKMGRKSQGKADESQVTAGKGKHAEG